MEDRNIVVSTYALLQIAIPEEGGKDEIPVDVKHRLIDAVIAAMDQHDMDLSVQVEGIRVLDLLLEFSRQQPAVLGRVVDDNNTIKLVDVVQTAPVAAVVKPFVKIMEKAVYRPPTERSL